MCLDLRKSGFAPVLAAAEIERLKAELETEHNSGNAMLEAINTLNFRLAEKQAEVERLRAEVADFKIKILAAVSVLTGFADRLGVDYGSLADMLADAQMRAEDDRDGP